MEKTLLVQLDTLEADHLIEFCRTRVEYFSDQKNFSNNVYDTAAQQGRTVWINLLNKLEKARATWA